MKELFSQFYAMGPNAQKSRAQIEQAGLTDAAHPISYNQLLAYADKYIGSTSMIRRATSLSGTTYSPWSSGTNYAMNDLVSYNGKRWQSTALNTTSAADYNNSTGYNKWDTASYNGDLWQVIKEPFFGKLNGVTPGSSADDGNWTRVADYSATKEYTKSGEVVRVGDNYYKKLKDKNTTGVDPSDTANWEFHEKRVSRGATPGGAGWLELPENGLTRDDFRSLINEVETIIGAFGADNQVAQLRNETLFNSRSNLLEGLGTFLKGQQNTRSTLARNA
jgi:hypothetical protein